MEASIPPVASWWKSETDSSTEAAFLGTSRYANYANYPRNAQFLGLVTPRYRLQLPGGNQKLIRRRKLPFSELAGMRIMQITPETRSFQAPKLDASILPVASWWKSETDSSTEAAFLRTNRYVNYANHRHPEERSLLLMPGAVHPRRSLPPAPYSLYNNITQTYVFFQKIC